MGPLARTFYRPYLHYGEWRCRSGRPSPDPGRPLRIGLVSPDFRCHPVGFFVAPVLRSRRREGCEFVGYSDVAVPDSMTEQMASSADRWRSTCQMDDAALSELVREDNIDILIDLAGTARNHQRPSRYEGINW